MSEKCQKQSMAKFFRQRFRRPLTLPSSHVSRRCTHPAALLVHLSAALVLLSPAALVLLPPAALVLLPPAALAILPPASLQILPPVIADYTSSLHHIFCRTLHHPLTSLHNSYKTSCYCSPVHDIPIYL